MSDKKLIYLDHASTTPGLPEVVLAVEPYWSMVAANPSSLHRCGQNAIAALDDARARIQKFVGADMPREIIFTGSATEANNLAIRGVVLKSGVSRAHVLAIATEHASVLEPLKALERAGAAEIEYVAVYEEGCVLPDDIARRVRETTALVSVGYANNEIGTVQHVAEIARAVRGKNSKTLIHTDAVQAALFLDMNVHDLGVDLMTFSAHKIYGPKGIGALYIKNGTNLEPVIYGGGQEYGLRAGTENVPLAAGFAKAAELAALRKNGENGNALKELRDFAFAEIRHIVPDAKLNGHPLKRLPNHLNVFIPSVDSEMFLVALSEEGICVSSGSACAARSQTLSHVIAAIGRGDWKGCHLRITFGIQTTRDDITALVRAIKKHLSRL